MMARVAIEPENQPKTDTNSATSRRTAPTHDRHTQITAFFEASSLDVAVRSNPTNRRYWRMVSAVEKYGISEKTFAQ